MDRKAIKDGTSPTISGEMGSKMTNSTRLKDFLSTVQECADDLVPLFEAWHASLDKLEQYNEILNERIVKIGDLSHQGPKCKCDWHADMHGRILEIVKISEVMRKQGKDLAEIKLQAKGNIEKVCELKCKEVPSHSSKTLKQ